MHPSDQLFRSVCEHAPDLIQTVRLDGRFVFANRAWLDRLGYGVEDLARLRFSDTVTADSRGHCEQRLVDATGCAVPLRLTAVLRARDGTPVPVDGWVIGGGTAEVPLVTAAFRPVSFTERRRHQLDRLFELSLDLLCIAGLDGYFKYINPAFERVLGYPREELLSRAFVDFVHPDDRAATLARLETLGSGSPVVDFQNRYRAADGSWRWLAWRSAPANEDGVVYAMARDITEQRRVQDVIRRQGIDLERSNEDLEQFAYAASHDLQAPLRAIANLAQFVSDDIADPPESVRRHLQQLDEKVGQMRRLVDDLLTYSRAGRRPDQVAKVATAEIVGQAVRMLSPPDTMTFDIGPDLPVIDTARSPLEVVFRNLIANAVKHHDRADGVIRISAQRLGEWWEFAVEDDGPGIPEQEREHIFQMFQRLGTGEGTGMGLALVKKIVERMGGTVRADAATNRGTVFRFTWPAQIAGAEEA